MTDQQQPQARGGELELELIARKAAEQVLDEFVAAYGVGADIPFCDTKGFSPAWAEGMLRELYDHHREVFGECVQAFLAEIRVPRRGRKPKDPGQ